MALVWLFDSFLCNSYLNGPLAGLGVLLWANHSNYRYLYYLFLYIPAIEDDEEEQSIKHHTNRRRKHTEEELKIGEEFTKDEIAEKFELLKEAFEELKGSTFEYFWSL